MPFIADIISFVENILAKESILTLSVCLHEGFVRDCKEQFSVSNSDSVQPSATDLPFHSCGTLPDSWSSWLAGLSVNSAWIVLKSLSIIGNITIGSCI